MSSKNRAPRQTRRERRAAAGPPAPPSIAIPAPLRGRPVVSTESLGLRKMSDVLEELVAPVIATFPPGAARTTIERVYQVGMSVWNATSPHAPPEQLDEIVTILASGGDRTAPQQIVDLMVARRRELFADDARVIANLQLQWAGDTPRLIVASVVPKEMQGR